MAADPTVPRTRRAVLGAALTGAAAAAAATVASAARPLDARAANSDPVTLGVANEATAQTSVVNTTDARTETAFRASSTGAGTGLAGTSASQTGVYGQSEASIESDYTDTDSRRTGVLGVCGTDDIVWSTDETGVYGYSNVSVNSTGVWGDAGDGWGVYGWGFVGVQGTASQAGGTGVFGDGDKNGTGVYGWTGTEVDSATTPVYAPPPVPGVGVLAVAQTTALTALQVQGKVKFSRSGRKTIGATASSLKVTMAGVTTASYVIATLQTKVSGCYVLAVVPGTGYFTIHLSKRPGVKVSVGYMVIN